MKTLYLLLWLFIVSLPSYADTINGRVIKVADGDTVTVRDASGTTYKVRLSGIDAPEKKQAFGNESKQSLSNLVDQKLVSIDWNKRDRYQRVVGKVMFNGRDVNFQQIKNGMAWHYKKYEKEQDVEDRSIYANAEYIAQRDKTGLWVDPKPEAPWDWRKLKRSR